MAGRQKKLNLIHMDLALQMAPRLAEPGVTIEMVATYLGTADQLNKARKDPSVMELLTEQAAALDAEEAAGLLADFFVQFKAWSKLSLGSSQLPKAEEMAKAVLTGAPSLPDSSSSS
ncbi:MAG: hypothetical protein P4L11_13710 [Geothrix sp.]|nr:hypothetical protein [Geothrix sp.]